MATTRYRVPCFETAICGRSTKYLISIVVQSQNTYLKLQKI